MSSESATQAGVGRTACLVRFEGVRLGRRRAPLLADVTFTVQPGQFWSFVIPSAEARKAMVRLLLGIARPRRGTAEWNRSFSTPRPASRIGFVPATFSLPPGLSMTVREYLRLGLIGIAGGGASEAQRIAWALEQVGLAGSESRDVARLQLGARAKLLLARALARRPRLLVADDPTTALANDASEDVLGAVVNLYRNERLTVAWVSAGVDVAREHALWIGAAVEGTLETAKRGDASFDRLLDACAPAELRASDTVRESSSPAAESAGRRAHIARRDGR